MRPPKLAVTVIQVCECKRDEGMKYLIFPFLHSDQTEAKRGIAFSLNTQCLDNWMVRADWSILTPVFLRLPCVRDVA